MKKETKAKIKKLILKIIKVLAIIFLIWIIYDIGMMRGTINGVYIVQTKNNKTVCDFMNGTRDIDDFCLLIEEEQEYRYYLDCGWEKFKIEGEKKPPFSFMVLEFLMRIVYYPAIGC